MVLVPSGKRWQFAIENGPVEIVDLPSYKMMIFHSYVSLPEGIYANMTGYIDGIHGTPYIAAPWIRHGNDKYG